MRFDKEGMCSGCVKLLKTPSSTDTAEKILRVRDED